MGVLGRWIKKYNSHSELKDTGKGRSSTMTKGRKTTWEERIEIVQDALTTERIIKKQPESTKYPINKYINGYVNMKLADGMR